MRGYLRRLVYYMFALYVVSRLVPGFDVARDIRGFVGSAVVIMLAFTLLSPLIRFVLLPINIVTLGLFSWLTQVVVFYIALLIVPTYFSIKSWSFAGLSISQFGISVAPMYIGVFATIIIAALMVSFMVGLVQWILG